MVQNSEETTVKISPPILLLISLQSLTSLHQIYHAVVDFSMVSHCLHDQYIYIPFLLKYTNGSKLCPLF